MNFNLYRPKRSVCASGRRLSSTAKSVLRPLPQYNESELLDFTFYLPFLWCQTRLSTKIKDFRGARKLIVFDIFVKRLFAKLFSQLRKEKSSALNFRPTDYNYFLFRIEFLVIEFRRNAF